MLVFVATAFCSCDKELLPSEPIADTPISFLISSEDEHVVTRAATPLDHDFVVWGYKSLTSGTQAVFLGYDVTFMSGTEGSSVDNTHCYSYVDEDKNQSIKYWDFNASEYNFWGYTGSKNDFQKDLSGKSDGTTLVINGLAQTVTEPDVTGQMFSSLYHRSPVSHDVVRLRFNRPYARVEVKFYLGEPLTGDDSFDISNITFGPSADSENIATEGSLTIHYPKTGNLPETYEKTATATGADLAFSTVTITASTGNSSNNAVTAVPVGGTDTYYVIPHDYSSSFLLNADIDGEPKTAAVPEELMDWNPNTRYTYIFKILEAGKKLEFYDIKVDPWLYGGQQDEEWKNW